MEELKQIISPESQEGEKISIEEIQNLDKKNLGEILKNIKETNPQLVSSLLSGLKDIVKENLRNIESLKGNSPENQAIIYAMQIYGSLCGMNIEINGIFNERLTSLEFKGLFLQPFRKPERQRESISEKLGIEGLEEAGNVNELLNKILENLAKNFAEKLNSPEGLSFKISDIYDDVVELLKEIDESLGENNIFKGNINLLINNFLNPRENGEALIKNTLRNILSYQEKKEIDSEDLNSFRITINGSINTLIDIAQNSSKEKLDSYLNEFKNIPEVNDYIKRIPDFEQIIDLIATLAKSLDKKEVNALIDNFFEKNNTNLLKIANTPDISNIEDNVKLDLVNDAWEVIDKLMNEDRIKISLDKLSQIKALKDNPIISELFDILKESKLDPKDLYSIFKEVSFLVLIVSETQIPEEEQSKKIKETLNNILTLISKFNREGKINEDKVVNFLKNLLGKEINEEKETSWLDIWDDLINVRSVDDLTNLWDKTTEKIGDYTEKFLEIKDLISDNVKNSQELLQFLMDNSDSIKTLLFTQSLEEVLRDAIRNRKLSDNILKASGDLIGRIEKIIKADTAQVILSMRDSFLENNNNQSDNTNNEEQEIALEIGNIFIDKIGQNAIDLVLSKIDVENPSNNQTLNKKEIIQNIFDSVKEIFNDDTLKKALFENAKNLGIDIGNKEEFITNLVNSFLNNNSFKKIIENVVSNVLNRIGNSKDLLTEIENIKRDFKSLVDNFITNYDEKGISGIIQTIDESSIFDKKTKAEIINSGFDFVYKYINSYENMRVLLNSFPEIKDSIPKGIKSGDLIKIGQELLASIGKEKVKDFIFSNLSSIDKAIKGELSQNETLELISKLYKEIPSEKRLEIVSSALEVTRGITSNAENSTNIEITLGNANSITEIIYSSIESNDTKKIKEILGNFSESFSVILNDKNLGRDNAENIISLLRAIPKERFSRFLKENSTDINEVIKNGNESKIITLAGKLFLEVDLGKFRRGIDESRLSKNELGILNLSESIQETLRKHRDKIDKIAETGNKIKNHFTSGEKLNISESDLESFAGIYEIISETFALEIENIKKERGISSTREARIILAETFELNLGEGNENTNINIDSGRMLGEFIKNNFGFLLSWGFDYVINSKEYVFKNAGIEYFLDGDKKGDFVNILKGYFS